MKKRLISLVGLMMLVVMVSLPVVSLASTMYVYTDNGGTLNVRNDPMVGDNIVGKLNYGSAVNVRLTMASGWACIDYAAGDGGVGYVQSRFLVNQKPGGSSGGGSSGSGSLSSINAVFKTAYKVNSYTVYARPARASGWVNLRWAPSTDAERITSCSQGKALTVIAEMKDWYQVMDPVTGMVGFISSQYISSF